MDHTDDFSQNWRIQGEGNDPLNETTIENFIKVYGHEQAIGYMRAVRDMMHELEFVIYDNRPDVGRGTRPLTRIKNNAEKLLAHKTNFLSSVDQRQLLNCDNKPE